MVSSYNRLFIMCKTEFKKCDSCNNEYVLKRVKLCYTCLLVIHDRISYHDSYTMSLVTWIEGDTQCEEDSWNFASRKGTTDSQLAESCKANNCYYYHQTIYDKTE